MSDLSTRDSGRHYTGTHRLASMTVAVGHDVVDEALAMLAVRAAAKPTVITVKPQALASSPQLATRTPTRVRMTFIAQPFRLIRAHEPIAHASPAWRPIMAA